METFSTGLRGEIKWTISHEAILGGSPFKSPLLEVVEEEDLLIYWRPQSNRGEFASLA